MFEYRNEVLRQTALAELLEPSLVDEMLAALVDRLDRRAAAASMTCSACEIAKPLREFGRDASALSALRGKCLACDAKAAASLRARKERA